MAVIDEIKKMDFVFRSLPPLKRKFYFVHPDIWKTLRLQLGLKDTASVFGHELNGIPIKVTDVAKVWEPPKSNSPYFEYTKEDTWLKQLGLGKMVPGILEMEEPTNYNFPTVMMPRSILMCTV